MNNKSIPPFYVGQEVVAVDAMDGSRIKNGQQYIVSDCHFSYCSNGNNFYWYVGVVGYDNKWMRPSIFAPITSTFQSIEYREVLEQERSLVSSN